MSNAALRFAGLAEARERAGFSTETCRGPGFSHRRLRGMRACEPIAQQRLRDPAAIDDSHRDLPTGVPALRERCLCGGERGLRCQHTERHRSILRLRCRRERKKRRHRMTCENRFHGDLL